MAAQCAVSAARHVQRVLFYEVAEKAVRESEQKILQLNAVSERVRDEYQAELATVQHALRASEERFDKSEDQLRALREQNSELQAQCEFYENKKVEFSALIKEKDEGYRKTLEELHSMRDKWEEELAAAKSQVESCQMEIDRLGEMKKRDDREKQELIHKHQMIEGQFEIEKAELCKTVMDLSQKKESFEARLSGMEKDALDWQQQNQELREAVDGLTLERAQMKEKFENLVREFARAKSLLTSGAHHEEIQARKEKYRNIEEELILGRRLFAQRASTFIAESERWKKRALIQNRDSQASWQDSAEPFGKEALSLEDDAVFSLQRLQKIIGTLKQTLSQDETNRLDSIPDSLEG